MTNHNNNGRKKVVIECTEDPDADVFVAGTFNNWEPEKKPMVPVDNNGLYQAVLMLPPGQYEYKLVISGDWRLDTSNPNWTLNGLGTLNSVIEVH